MKSQWYVKCDQMAQRAIEAVEKGHLKIIPDFHVATWRKWLENIRYFQFLSLVKDEKKLKKLFPTWLVSLFQRTAFFSEFYPYLLTNY